MAKRGFFAELQRQSQAATRQRQQAVAKAQREQTAAARRSEQNQKRAERERAQQTKTAVAQLKQREREAQQAHVESQLDKVVELNAQAAQDLADIESILSTAIDPDSYVDLEQFRIHVEHPPFPGADLKEPLPPPAPIDSPEEPQYVEAAAPGGLGAVFGGKKRHEAAVAAARAEYAEIHGQWQSTVAQIPMLQLEQMREHQLKQQARQQQLEEAQSKYDAECAQREKAVAETNSKLDEFIAGLETGTKSAVEDYVDLVLGTSGYPARFPVTHEVTFDATSRELTIETKIPSPDDLPTAKDYRYNKAKDEITSSSLTQKARKDLYTSALHQVALRGIHEVFEADRFGHVRTIALTVDCEAIDPATGRMQTTRLLAVAADRDTYEDFDLHNVVPSATLEHMSAVVSKNPYGRVGIDESRGVRGGT